MPLELKDLPHELITQKPQVTKKIHHLGANFNAERPPHQEKPPPCLFSSAAEIH